jgi:hypothetical protein
MAGNAVYHGVQRGEDLLPIAGKAPDQAWDTIALTSKCEVISGPLYREMSPPGEPARGLAHRSTAPATSLAPHEGASWASRGFRLRAALAPRHC